MKTTHHTNHTTKRTTLGCLLPVLAAAVLSSCGNQSVALSQAEPAPSSPSTSFRVWHRDAPALPRGVADDAATNGWEGMWGGPPIEFDDVPDAGAMIPLLRVSLAL